MFFAKQADRGRMGRTPITRDRLKAGEVVMHGIEKLKPEGPGLPDTDVCRPLKESAPTVRQSIEEWLRQSLAAQKAREARMEEMRLFIESTRDDRERRLREQAEAWERKKAVLEDRVEILGFTLETPGEVLEAEAKPEGRLLKPSERAREALDRDAEASLIHARA